MSKQHREVGYVGKPGEQPLNLQSLCDRLNEMFNVDDTPDELSTEAREAIEALWEERDQLVLKLDSFGVEALKQAALAKELETQRDDQRRVLEATEKAFNQVADERDALQSRLEDAVKARDVFYAGMNGATERVFELESRLDKALVFVDYIAKRYEQEWDDPITERFYNEAKALLVETRCPVCNGNDASEPCAYPREQPAGCLYAARKGRVVERQKEENPLRWPKVPP